MYLFIIFSHKALQYSESRKEAFIHFFNVQFFFECPFCTVDLFCILQRFVVNSVGPLFLKISTSNKNLYKRIKCTTFYVQCTFKPTILHKYLSLQTLIA